MRALFALLAAAGALLAATGVEKVEPPSWWLGSAWHPVRLLIRGQDFQGAQLDAQAPLKTGRISVNANGTYLFADLTIPASAKPGKYKLTVRSKGGEASGEFEVLPAPAQRQRFQGFSPDDVMYLAMPDRFANGDTSNDDPAVSPGLLNRKAARYYHGGDLQGVIDHEAYLNELGVTALWLNPWYDNANRLNSKERYDNADITDYHGYGTVDFYGVDEHLGTLQLLQEMTNSLHGRGIKLVQDQVANHTGPYHPWVTNSPNPDWYNGTEAKHLANDWQTWTLMDPHGTPQVKRSTLEGWFLNILPDLNQYDSETRIYLIQNSIWWVGVTGLDAIRQDTMPYVPRDYWRDWTMALKREFPRMRVVGEVFDGDPALVSFYQEGVKAFDGIDTGVDSLFDFPLYFGLRKTFGEGQSVRETAKVLAHDAMYSDPNMLVTFLGLHDVGRFMNETGATVHGLKLAQTFLLTMRGVPMLYYGDEIAMRGGNDPDNRRDFPGGWKEDDHNAFTATGRTAEENEVFDHVRKLVSLRRASAALRRGKTVNLFVGEQQWVYARIAPDETALMVLNNAKVNATVTADVSAAGVEDGTVWSDRLGIAAPVTVENGRILVTLPARSGVVLMR